MNRQFVCAKSIRSILLLFFVHIFSGILSVSTAIAAQGEKGKLDILFLSSFTKNVPAQTLFERGLNKALSFMQGQHNIYYEFMDIQRLNEENVNAALSHSIEKKYEGVGIEFIVAWGHGATHLLQINDHLFPEARRIFVEANRTQIPFSERDVVIGVETDYRSSLKEVLRLEQPNKIVVIGTTGDISARARLTNIKTLLEEEAGEVGVEFILDRHLEEIASKLKNTPRKGTSAIYLLMFSDGKGRNMSPYSVAQYLSANSAVPIFSLWDSLVGSGIVGGNVLSIEKIGDHTGQVITSLRNGVPVSEFSPMSSIYDWSALQKWNIEEKKLAGDAVIINRPPDLLNRYKYQIVAVVVTISLLVLFALYLMRVLAHRNAAITELDKWWKIFKNAEWGVAVGGVKDPKLRLLNPAYAKMHGYTVDEMYQRDVTMVFPTQFHSQLPEIMKKCHELGHFSFEADHIRKDGTTFPVFHTVTTVNDHEGKPSYRIVNVLDITAQKQNEDELRRYRDQLENMVQERTAEISRAHQLLQDNEEKYRSLAEAAFEGIVITENGIIVEVNDAFCGMLDYRPSELIEIPAITLVPQKEKANVKDKILSGYDQSYESSCLKKDGSIIPVEVHAKMFTYKGRLVRVTALRDISERKQAESLLLEREQLYRSMFENNSSIMLLINLESSKIVDANKSACAFYGFSRKTIRTMKISDINTLSKHEIENELVRAKADKKKYFNFRHRLSDGSIRDVEVFSGPVMVSGRSLLCSIIHDITDRKIIEREREGLINELQKTMAEIKTLQGFLPICSSCKKIRDDEGYWNQIESYISKHSEAKFSHSMCGDCAKNLYGDEDWFINDDNIAG